MPEEMKDLILNGENVTDEQWREMWKIYINMPDNEFEEFSDTLAGRILVQMCASIDGCDW